MEDLKFEFEGKYYNVPFFPKDDWEWMNSISLCPMHRRCTKECYKCSGREAGCIYGQYNAEVRRAFYFQCFPEKQFEEDTEPTCEVKIEPPKDPELIDKIADIKKPDWANWAAVDKCGLAYWYSGKPEILDGIPHVWLTDGKSRFLGVPGHYNPENWKDSLIDLRGSKPVLVTEKELNEKLNNLYVRSSVLEVKHHYFDYTLARSSTITGLNKIIRDLMKDGWIPQGGVVKDGDFYMQAMVKK